MPNIGNTQLKLLEKLCNASAVSGDEGEVRKIVLEELKGHVEDIRVDCSGQCAGELAQDLARTA